MSLSALSRPLTALTEAASKALSVSRVYGEPITAGDTTIIPVATVLGGHGMGLGDDAVGSFDDDDAPDATDTSDTPGDEAGAPPCRGGAGGGGGFGVVGWPAGAYVVENGQTTWRPAIDANLLILGGAALATCLVTAIASVAAIKSLGRGAAHMADTAGNTMTTLGAQAAGAFGTAVGATASTVDAAIDAAAGAASTVAGATSAAFASAAGSAAGAFGSAARKATDSAVEGARIASAAALELGGLGARALGDTVGATERTLTETLGRRRGHGKAK